MTCLFLQEPTWKIKLLPKAPTVPILPPSWLLEDCKASWVADDFVPMSFRCFTTTPRRSFHIGCYIFRSHITSFQKHENKTLLQTNLFSIFWFSFISKTCQWAKLSKLCTEVFRFMTTSNQHVVITTIESQSSRIVRTFDRKCGCIGFHSSHRTCKHKDKIKIMTAEESKDYMAKTEVHQLFEVRRNQRNGGNARLILFYLFCVLRK